MSEVKIYDSLGQIVTDLSDILLPPERIGVAEAAEKYRRVYNPPMYVGPWNNSIAPYLMEPMNLLESPEYSAVCVVAPAQSMKTEIILNWIARTVKCDPSDFMVIEKSQTEAKVFSMMKVDRMLTHSPELNSELIARRTANNVHDKRFRTGTYLLIQWPTENAVAGKTLRRVALTDYDRMPQDIGGEGSPFDLARRRTNTYKRLGMTYVESSPSFDITDPRWRKPRPDSHEAPPTDGILGIYNRGDRRRRYWQCPHCREWFEPDFSTLRWPDSSDPMECAEQAFMACPHCFDETGAIITQSMRNELDSNGVWLREGEKIDRDGNRHGKPRRSDIASFWIKGPNTAFAQWKNLVLNYLLAMSEFESTGNDRSLKTTINTEQGLPYMPPDIGETRAPEDLMERAVDIGEKVVPENVRALFGMVDVQANRFEVAVLGVIPTESSFDICLIDRFEIRKSKRVDEDGDVLWVKPGSYIEDWNLITEQVIERTYPLCDGSGFMGIKMVLCDSGGKKGVTSNAYEYYKSIRQEYGSRFILCKGEPNLSAPRVRKSFPDSGRKDRKAGARGEIPVLMINVNNLKDWLDKMLSRTTPGGGFIVFPDWLPIDYYKELCAEVRNPNTGRWENKKKLRNETTDLIVYFLAGLLYLRVDRMCNSGNLPNWLSDWDENPLVVRQQSGEGQSPVIQKTEYDELHELSKVLT